MSILSSKRLTLQQVAERCCVHRSTPTRWATQGVRGRTLPTFLIGGRRYVLEEDLEAFLQANHPNADVETDQQRQRTDAAGKLLDSCGVKPR